MDDERGFSVAFERGDRLQIDDRGTADADEPLTRGEALRDEKVRQIFNDQAQEPTGGTAEQYARQVREDSDKYQRLVRELNVKVE